MHRLVIVLSLALQVLPVAGGWPAQAAEIQIICDVEFVLPFVNSDYGARKAPVKPGWDKRQQGRGGSGRRLDLAKMGRVRDRVTLTGAGRQSNLSSNRLIIAERCARSVDRAHIVDVCILGDDVGAFGADSADPSGRLPELADGVLFSRRALPRPDWATLVGGIGAPRWPSSMTPNVVVPNNAPTPASADEVRDRLRGLALGTSEEVTIDLERDRRVLVSEPRRHLRDRNTGTERLTGIWKVILPGWYEKGS